MKKHLILLAFTKHALCSRYGSLQAGKDSCDKARHASMAFGSLDHFMLGPQPCTALWFNCLRHAA